MPPSALSPPRPKHFEELRTTDQRSPRRSCRPELPHLPAQSRSLQDLHARVVDALSGSGYAALALIGCEVEPGRVILRGAVPSYHLKQLAQVHVLRVDGIGRLENRLEVRGRRPC